MMNFYTLLPMNLCTMSSSLRGLLPIILRKETAFPGMSFELDIANPGNLLMLHSHFIGEMSSSDNLYVIFVSHKCFRNVSNTSVPRLFCEWPGEKIGTVVKASNLRWSTLDKTISVKRSPDSSAAKCSGSSTSPCSNSHKNPSNIKSVKGKFLATEWRVQLNEPKRHLFGYWESYADKIYQDKVKLEKHSVEQHNNSTAKVSSRLDPVRASLMSISKSLRELNQILFPELSKVRIGGIIDKIRLKIDNFVNSWDSIFNLSPERSDDDKYFFPEHSELAFDIHFLSDLSFSLCHLLVHPDFDSTLLRGRIDLYKLLCIDDPLERISGLELFFSQLCQDKEKGQEKEVAKPNNK